MPEHPLLAPDQARPLARLQSPQGVVVDVAPAQGQGEDPPQRRQRSGDRLRGKPLQPKLGDQPCAVVGRHLLHGLPAQQGQDVALQVVAVVLERPLRALPRAHLRLQALQQHLRQLREANPARLQELPALRLRAQQIPLPPRLAQLRPHGLEARLALDQQVDAVGAVSLPVDAALHARALHERPAPEQRGH